MNRANGLTKVITAGFFLLAVTGFVAYRAGWLFTENKIPALEETPDVPVAPARLEEIPDNNPAVPGTTRKTKTATSRIPGEQTDSVLPATDSLVIIDNDEMRKKMGLPPHGSKPEKEEYPVMFSGSKSGHIIKPAELKPLKPIFDSLFKPAKQKP